MEFNFRLIVQSFWSDLELVSLLSEVLLTSDIWENVKVVNHIQMSYLSVHGLAYLLIPSSGLAVKERSDGWEQTHSVRFVGMRHLIYSYNEFITKSASIQ